MREMKSLVLPPVVALLTSVCLAATAAAQGESFDRAQFERVYSAAEELRRWFGGQKDPVRLVELQREFAAEVAAIKPQPGAPATGQAHLAALYSEALEALTDHGWLSDLDVRRRRLRRARELLGKTLKGTLDEVDLIPYANMSRPESNDPTTERVGALVRKYRLGIEERKFDSKEVKGVYAFVSDGWSASILGVVANLLGQAAKAYEDAAAVPSRQTLSPLIIHLWHQSSF